MEIPNINPFFRAKYLSDYQESLQNPESFWGQIAARLDWVSPWTNVMNCRLRPPVKIRWFEGGKLNVSSNCLDRHLKKRGDKIAIIWEPDSPNESSREITYRELYEMVNKAANVLKNLGVKKGDRVTIYLPMIPEAAVAMLACTRIGAIHSVVFGGFSADSIRDRILDGKSDFVITADEGRRGGKVIPLKSAVDLALEKCPGVRKVLVVKRGSSYLDLKIGRDLWWHDEIAKAGAECAPEIMDAEDPLFLLYTSGSTNKPKGVLHTTGGYLVYASYTHEIVFDLKEDDIYFCTADLGWITGHSYLLYGPLCNGATTLMFEGVPTYPSSSRLWEIVDKHKVSIFYTAPTAIRALMKEGDAPVKRSSRKSLRILGSVGEPINPEAWLWYYRVVGDERCPVVDTWWQTETGGILISPIPGVTKLKPGSATEALFGIEPVIFSAEGKILEGAGEGILCLATSWPGQMRSLYGDHKRFEETYFKAYPGYYFTGDGCRRDEEGYYWITGRVDDVINVAGHRLGTAEIESSLVGHPQVAEAAVVGFPHDIKGQGIYAFVTLKSEVKESAPLKSELIQWVRKEISPIATPDIIQWAPALPKTRSGKIMRRILRKIAEGATDNLGDISTLADPKVVEDLLKGRIQFLG